MTRKSPPKVPEKLKGRPNRAEAARRAILAVGVDPNLVDPRRVLASIAVDETAPAGARVAACKALLATAGEPALTSDGATREPEPVLDELTRRSLALMSRQDRPN